jgi:hypothetical protein
MSKTTRQSLNADLNELLESGETACRTTGAGISRIVRRLQFWGASTTELRGIGDAGLSDETLVAICRFSSVLEGQVFGDICEHLWAEEC